VTPVPAIQPVVRLHAGAAWSHAGWTLHHWDLDTRTMWTASGLSREVLLDQVQAHATQPPVYLWLPPAAAGGAVAREASALRPQLQRLFPESRGVVRGIGGPAEGFAATVQRLIEGTVTQEQPGQPAGAAEGQTLSWTTIASGVQCLISIPISTAASKPGFSRTCAACWRD
jgi:hypothetical protein